MNTAIQTVADVESAAASGGISFEVALIILGVCVVIAFFAMRLYKIFMSLFGAVGIGYIAYTLIGPGAIFANLIPSNAKVDIAAAISLGAAIIGFIIGVALPKFVLFLGGIGVGVVATKIAIPIFAPGVDLDKTIMLIVGVVVGLIIGVLLSLLFRPVYIFLSSLGCSAVAGVVVSMLVMPSLNVLIGMGIGMALGIIPMAYQFRSSAFEA